MTNPQTRDEIVELMKRKAQRGTIYSDLQWSVMLSDALTALEQAGYVVVPRIPTDAMLDAAAEEHYGCDREYAKSIAKEEKFEALAFAAGVTYTAMLTAYEGEIKHPQPTHSEEGGNNHDR